MYKVAVGNLWSLLPDREKRIQRVRTTIWADETWVLRIVVSYNAKSLDFGTKP